MTIINTNSISGINSITAQGSSGVAFYDSSGSSERLRIDSAGRIGVGGNGIGSGLGVYLQRSSPATTHFYEASDGTKKMISGVDSTNDYVKIGSLSSHRVGLVAQNSEKLSILPSGNIGIGLTNPEKNLVVSGSSSPTIRINNSDGSISADQTIGAIEFKANDGSGDGSQVTGSIESISQAAFSGQGSPSHLIFKTNGVSGPNALTERLRITSGGQVLVGNYATHSAIHGNLEVNGNDGINISNATRTGTNGAQWRLIPHNGGGSATNLRLFEGAGGVEVLNITKAGKIILTNSTGIQFGSSDTGTNITSQTLDDYEEGTFTPNLDVSGTSGSLSIGYSSQVGRYVKVGRIVHFTIDIRLSSWSRGTGTGGIMVQGLPFSPVDSGNYSRATGFCNLYNWNYSSDSADIPVWSIYQQSGLRWVNIIKHREGNIDADISDPGSSSMLFFSGTYEAGA